MKVGDLVEYIFEGNRFSGRTFTVMEISPGWVYCITGNMITPYGFELSNVRIIEDKPKFIVGSIIINKENPQLNGVVLGSNHRGSVIRRCEVYSNVIFHTVLYISNRKYKKVS